MAGLGLLRVQSGDVQGQLGLAQLGLGGQGLVHPDLHIVGLHPGQGQRRSQRCGLNADAAHELIQGHALDLKVILRSDFLGRDQIEAGLGFA